MTPADFIAKWKNNKLSERAGAQAHFLDLCELLGVGKPTDPDQYCFERGAKRTGAAGNRHGWADVWKRHAFAWEYKAPHANLQMALKQLMTYALALDNPPLLVVSDRLHIEIHTHFTGTPSETFTIALEDIGTPENLQRLRHLFDDPEQFKPKRTRTAITLQAAKLIGDLAWQMQQRGHDPQQVAHFLNKIIFCLFAEDARGPASEPLLPERLFSKVLETGQKDVERFQRQLKNLFHAMSDRHGEFGEHLIQWFNGGLFDDDLTLPLTHDDITKLINVALLDWSAIEPSIFGTLFERGLDPAKRSQLGAHYTDPVSIMRIVNPVIVEPLLEDWRIEKETIAAQMAVFHEFENSRKPAEKAKATNALKDATRRYITFKEKLKDFKVLDPACGSGNFLYLALQSLKDIELRVGLEAEELGLERGFPEVGPQAMHGIELSPYAAELAKVTVWIGDIQWMLKHGFAPSKEPILKTLDQIQCRDALLAYPKREAEQSWRASQHKAGQLAVTTRGDFELLPDITETEWPSVDAIIGNPPFLGGSKMREEMGDEYTEGLRGVYIDKVPGGADLVCYWFAKAQDALIAKRASRVGLVATNSIRGGANRKVLDHIVNDGEIFNAWSDEEWVNEGAAVRVSIVCFQSVGPEPAEGLQKADNGSTSSPRTVFLDGRNVTSVNSDLSGRVNGASALDLTLAKKLRENSGFALEGMRKDGPFDIEGSVAREWIASPNAAQVHNRDVLFPRINGRELLGRPADGWVIDFASRSVDQAALFHLPFQYVKATVKPVRDENRDRQRRERWWLFGRSNAELRPAIKDMNRFIATVRHSKHRLFTWLPEFMQPDTALVVVPKDDDSTIGVLHSAFHELWSLKMCSWLGVGNDPRYTPSTCFDTFPFPEGLTPDLKPE